MGSGSPSQWGFVLGEKTYRVPAGRLSEGPKGGPFDDLGEIASLSNGQRRYSCYGPLKMQVEAVGNGTRLERAASGFSVARPPWMTTS